MAPLTEASCMTAFWIPAFAGMTKMGKGMAKIGNGMTEFVKGMAKIGNGMAEFVKGMVKLGIGMMELGEGLVTRRPYIAVGKFGPPLQTEMSHRCSPC